jgi:hypothetical protein
LHDEESLRPAAKRVTGLDDQRVRREASADQVDVVLGEAVDDLFRRGPKPVCPQRQWRGRVVEPQPASVVSNPKRSSHRSTSHRGWDSVMER